MQESSNILQGVIMTEGACEGNWKLRVNDLWMILLINEIWMKIGKM
jgi:hypothetical protein